jgi:hypothetical protein
MPNSNHRFNRSAIILALAILSSCVSVLAQGQSYATQNLEWAQRFLLTMYPDLRNLHYDLTTTVYSSFDVTLTRMRRLDMQVGQAPPGTIFGIMGSGSLGLQPPKGKAKPGPVYAKQFLIVNFGFDKNERFSSFAAGGPEVERPEADQVEMNLRELSPEHQWTDAQADAELKKAGAMYVSIEKEKFLKSLPLDELEKLFGKITVVSADFKVLRDGDPGPPGRAEWLVVIRAKQTDGAQLTYRMVFEPFMGVLTNMDAVSP